MAFRVQAIQGVPYWVGEDSTVYILPSVHPTQGVGIQRVNSSDAAGTSVHPTQEASVHPTQEASVPPALVSLGRYVAETDTVLLDPSWKEHVAPSLLAYRQRLGDYTQEKLKESPPLVKGEQKPSPIV